MHTKNAVLPNLFSVVKATKCQKKKKKKCFLGFCWVVINWYVPSDVSDGLITAISSPFQWAQKNESEVVWF